MIKNKLKVIPLVLTLLVTSCLSNIPNNNNLDNFGYRLDNIYRRPISGKVEFPSFKTKTTVSDIATEATVSLIYPADHSTKPNNTIATGLTDTSGNFIINTTTSFNPILGEVFILEAIKRVGGVGKNAIAVRTNIQWNGNGWDSITTPSIRIDSKTTSLSVISDLNPSAISAKDTIKKMNIVNNIIQVSDINSNVNAITINHVKDLIEEAFILNKDPIATLKYENGEYKRISSSFIYYENLMYANLETPSINQPEPIIISGVPAILGPVTVNYFLHNADGKEIQKSFIADRLDYYTISVQSPILPAGVSSEDNIKMVLTADDKVSASFNLNVKPLRTSIIKTEDPEIPYMISSKDGSIASMLVNNNKLVGAVFQLPDERSMKFNIGDNNLPSQVVMGNDIILFKNYTNTTFDAAIVHKGQETQIIENIPYTKNTFNTLGFKTKEYNLPSLSTFSERLEIMSNALSLAESVVKLTSGREELRSLFYSESIEAISKNWINRVIKDPEQANAIINSTEILINTISCVASVARDFNSCAQVVLQSTKNVIDLTNLIVQSASENINDAEEQLNTIHIPRKSISFYVSQINEHYYGQTYGTVSVFFDGISLGTTNGSTSFQVPNLLVGSHHTITYVVTDPLFQSENAKIRVRIEIDGTSKFYTNDNTCNPCNITDVTFFNIPEWLNVLHIGDSVNIDLVVN